MEAVSSDETPDSLPCLLATPVLGRATTGGHQALKQGPTPERPNSGRLRPAMTQEAKQRWLECQEQS